MMLLALKSAACCFKGKLTDNVSSLKSKYRGLFKLRISLKKNVFAQKASCAKSSPNNFLRHKKSHLGSMFLFWKLILSWVKAFYIKKSSKKTDLTQN